MNFLLYILLGLIAFFPGEQDPPTGNPGADTFTLIAQKVVAKPGTTVCMSISAYRFNKIIGLQYSLTWDPKVLEFERVANFHLPWLKEENFGTNRVADGIMTFVWIDNSLKGTSLANGEPVYEICFKVRGKTGASSKIGFSPNPTPYEVVDVNEKLLQFVPVDGMITVK